MPVEFRKIVFSPSEVRIALTRHCARHHFKGSQPAISGLEQEWGEGGLDLTLTCQDGGTRTRIELGEADVAAALIAYCQDNDAKVPHYAHKALEKAGEGIALLLQHDWRDQTGSPLPGR